MSRSEKNKQGATEPQEKVLTRYDLKMQRRQEQKRKDARDRKIAVTVGVLLLAALICLLASFPIRNWMTVNGTYIVVANENVSRVEFDYNYNLVSNSYINSERGYILSIYGSVDWTGDLSQQIYSGDLTWKDFFEQLAVNNILHNKALAREMKAAGFSYDVETEFQEYKENLQQAASDAGMTLDAYVKEIYGSYATMSRIEGYVRNGISANAYYNSVAEGKTPGDGAIQAYYEENKDDYDSVDYRLIAVDAELPTEPTELADPVEETEEGEESEETAYTPSEAEIEAAMALAETEAQSQLKNLAADGELYNNMQRSSVSSLFEDWLFDNARKPGDTTVIEDSANHRYYALELVSRYLDQTPTVDVRVIVTESGNGQTVLDEWKAGDATEESFEALVEQYSTDSYSISAGGLYEGMTASDMAEALTDWTFNPSRAGGDTAVVSSEENEIDYVIYYVKSDDPAWKLNISSILLNEIMIDYMDEITEGMEVKDPHNNLRYLEVQAQEAQAENQPSEGNDGTDGAGDETDSGDDGTSAE